MSYFQVPSGMTRRHFMSHLAGAAAMASPAIAFTNSLMASAVDMKKKNKACIMLWMGGGPSTIDMFDMKPGAPPVGNSSRSRRAWMACKLPSTCPSSPST